MKKIKFLMPTIGIAATITAPITTLVSCSKTVAEQLKESLIYEFKQMCKIPHSSDKILYNVPYKSNVMEMSNYLVKRVGQLIDTKVWQDKWGNIWFDVPYNDETKKDLPTVGLQAHMDMVFSYDPKKYLDGNYPDPKTTAIDFVEETVDGKRVIHSRDYKTSIGADNGVGVAQILALIGNKNVKHGNLRVIITNCEENAMQGAKLLIDGVKTDEEEPQLIEAGTNPHVLDGVKYMINIDGETEGEYVTACSGGVGSHYSKTWPINNEDPLLNRYKLTIDGFEGGHSGDAPHEHKGNALIIANEILAKISEYCADQIQFASISTPGTTVYNKLPKTCEVEFACSQELINSGKFDSFKSEVISAHDKESLGWKYYNDMNKDKWTLKATTLTRVLDAENSKKIITLQTNLGYGVEEWNEEAVLKTSRNIGPCTLSIDASGQINFKLSTYSRSDDMTKVRNYKTKNVAEAAKAGVDYMCDAEFPSWKGDSKRDLVELTKKAMEEAGIKTTKEAKIHGGVESSWWATAMKDISGIADSQGISYGPRIDNCHESTETLYLDTLEACIKTTLYILQNIK